MLHHLKDKLHEKAHGIHELISCTSNIVVEYSDQVIEHLENEAEKALHTMTEHLQQMNAQSTALADANALARKVVTGADKVVTYLEAVTDWHPVSKTVISSIRAVIELEKARQETSALIVTIHASMINTALHMRALTPILKERDGLRQSTVDILQAMAKTIKEFGTFVDLYNRHRQKIFRFLLAPSHNKQLVRFNESFEKHKSQLQGICTSRAATDARRKLDDIQKQLSTVISDTCDIKRSLQNLLVEDAGAGTIADVKAYVEANGGYEQVIKDDGLLNRVGEMFGEHVPHRMKVSLRHDYGKLLQDHAERYEMKLQVIESNILSTFKSSHANLSRQFKEGPHELIDDADIKEIWKINGWKSSVKCRVFIEGLREHYQYKICTKFESSERHHDAWTVEVFARMMYHSAIGDVVDEDGSGFVTPTEVNTFCSTKGRRPPHWTTPQWLAFCASGWYNNNAWYYSRIKSTLKQIDAEIENQKHSDPYRKYLQAIIVSLKPLLFIEEVDDVEEHRDERDDVGHKLLRLQEDYRNSELKWIQSNLQKLQYHLDDKAAVAAAIGDHRIELHIMCILHLFVEHILKEIIDNGSIHDATESCIVSYLAFEDRIDNLMRGWRSQGRDVDLQLGRYADGLFRNIEREAFKRQRALETLCSMLFNNAARDRYSKLIRPASYRSPHVQLHTITQQMSQVVSEQASLTSQVADLAKKMDRIEQLLLQRPHFDVTHAFRG